MSYADRNKATIPQYLKAIIPDTPKMDGRNYSGDKELTDSYTVLAVTTGEDGTPILSEIVNARCWMSRSRNASVVYAGIWISRHDTGTIAAGHGTAGGYGYHKASAAIQEAIDSTGIKLMGSPYNRPAEAGSYEAADRVASIGGCGTNAIRDALCAIAAAMGYTHLYVI